MVRKKTLKCERGNSSKSDQEKQEQESEKALSKVKMRPITLPDMVRKEVIKV